MRATCSPGYASRQLHAEFPYPAFRCAAGAGATPAKVVVLSLNHSVSIANKMASMRAFIFLIPL
ncbi:MAG: hypothetical protein WB799_10995 [Candidatus Sulfotelmatobacter sp.]